MTLWLKNNALILFLIFLGIILRLFVGVKTGISFDYDQERDASSVMQMVWELKPAIVGPRVANDSGFFLGPYHYYFLLPFFLITGGHPIAGPMASIFVSSLTTYFYYFVGKKISGAKTGLLAALVSIFLIDLNSWNPMYFSIVTLIYLSLLFDVVKFSKNHIWLVALCGLAVNLHLAMGLFSVITLLVIMLKKNLSLRMYLSLLAAYAIWFIPLLAFNLRHEGIIVQSIGRFLNDSAGGVGSNVWEKLGRSLEIAPMWNTIYRSIIKLIFGIGFLLLLKQTWMKFGKLMFLCIFLIVSLPVVTLSFYRGNLPEYYFGMVIAFIPLALGKIFESKFYVGLVAITLWGFVLVNYKSEQKVTIPLASKIDLINYLVNQTEDEYVNFSYDVPLGYNYGYEYLLKYLKVPLDRGNRGHLYTLIHEKMYKDGEVVKTVGELKLVRR